jgi:hypothetical protein
MHWRVLGTVCLAAVCASAQRSANPAVAEPTAVLQEEWIAPPQLTGNDRKGSLILTNQSDDDFDQTIIIEAVNENGKAFALGYQHFTLQHRSRSVPIHFDSTLPPGRYTVRADAVAEVAARHAIHRAHLAGPKPIVVTVI